MGVVVERAALNTMVLGDPALCLTLVACLISVELLYHVGRGRRDEGLQAVCAARVAQHLRRHSSRFCAPRQAVRQLQKHHGTVTFAHEAAAAMLHVPDGVTGRSLQVRQPRVLQSCCIVNYQVSFLFPAV